MKSEFAPTVIEITSPAVKSSAPRLGVATVSTRLIAFTPVVVIVGEPPARNSSLSSSIYVSVPTVACVVFAVGTAPSYAE